MAKKQIESEVLFVRVPAAMAKRVKDRAKAFRVSSADLLRWGIEAVCAEGFKPTLHS